MDSRDRKSNANRNGQQEQQQDITMQRVVQNIGIGVSVGAGIYALYVSMGRNGTVQSRALLQIIIYTWHLKTCLILFFSLSFQQLYNSRPTIDSYVRRVLDSFWVSLSLPLFLMQLALYFTYNKHCTWLSCLLPHCLDRGRSMPLKNNQFMLSRSAKSRQNR